ncbi:hypothetical protein [Streptosporangium sp. NPDC023615]|uniref:hypothetical protein n=1 Tax=Streptosporangium sp. NPDC023615 TaxID=3154794 RepID=UPI00342AFE83
MIGLTSMFAAVATAYRDAARLRADDPPSPARASPDRGAPAGAVQDEIAPA